MDVRGFVAVLSMAGVFSVVLALQCYKCGQYNDGVGSITPCINSSHMKLSECPSKEHVYCIKYVSEGSTIKDCVPKCTEKDTWNTRTYCCSEDGCNSSPPTKVNALLAILLIVMLGCVSQ